MDNVTNQTFNENGSPTNFFPLRPPTTYTPQFAPIRVNQVRQIDFAPVQPSGVTEDA